MKSLPFITQSKLMSSVEYILQFIKTNIFAFNGQLQILFKTRTMQQKLLLINSMEKLINHIVVSRKNQEQIFASLSKNDFKKIISNLDDENLKLRKISLALISQLLHNNNVLKEKFCHIMNIPLCPGRVALSTKLCASSNKSKSNIAIDMNNNIKDVFTLLKQPISELERQSLFWFINYDNKEKPLRLEYFTTNQNSQINQGNQALSFNINDLMDPVDCMIGFILPERLVPKKMEAFTPNPSLIEPRRKSQYDPATSNKLVNNYFKPHVYKPEQIRQYPPTNININHSLTLNPGYSTDRDMNYAPRSGMVVPNNRPVNTSMYQEMPNNYGRQTEPIASPMNHPLKANSFEIDNFNRVKYGGIKLISNPNTGKNKESGKYFEEQPAFIGSVTSTGGKSISFTNGSSGISSYNNSGAKNISMNINMRQKGYETLREKKIIQKYP